MHYGVTHNPIPNSSYSTKTSHFIVGSMNKQVRICSMMKASIRRRTAKILAFEFVAMVDEFWGRRLLKY